MPGASGDSILPFSCQAPTPLVTGHCFLSLGLSFLTCKVGTKSSAPLAVKMEEICMLSMVPGMGCPYELGIENLE